MLTAHLVPLHTVCHLVSHSSLFKVDIITLHGQLLLQDYIVCK